MIQLDNGFYYGLGVFETIAVEAGCPLFLDCHLARLQAGVDFLGIDFSLKAEDVLAYLADQPLDHHALKIAVSEKNIIYSERPNPYTFNQYQEGISCCLSEIQRNPSSPYIYHKTFQYGDNLYALRKAKAAGYREAVFTNAEGLVCEGATSNLFMVRAGEIYTPKKSAGLLPGTVRSYLIDNFPIKEVNIPLEALYQADEVFVTNALMGIMPVRQVGQAAYQVGPLTRNLMGAYGEEVRRQVEVDPLQR
ncbi:aminotransferase class IV [Aerococcus sp. UMB8487]|uniref:aminotransferase class IV n=1 Tax=Aerococcus sp. UMB8487 TaxID=3046346 RepID=UPI002549EC80|nr:aminotransferase class IV [Aerococcus sp. UMB8487]MDK6939418.1 aminotransferase class IV [Aerococcus sp. UMB8487]